MVQVRCPKCGKLLGVMTEEQARRAKIPLCRHCKKEEMETRRCNVCGEEWPDTGYPFCPFCQSGNTEIVAETEDDDEGNC